jgi:hypothetical protein
MAGTFVPNTHPDDSIRSLVPKEINLRQLIGQDPEPMSDANRTMCLSYHLRPGSSSPLPTASRNARGPCPFLPHPVVPTTQRPCVSPRTPSLSIYPVFCVPA